MTEKTRLTAVRLLRRRLHVVSHHLAWRKKLLRKSLRNRSTRAVARWDLRRQARRPAVALGWTTNRTGGVKNHLTAIQRHSCYRPRILPSDLCIRAGRGHNLTSMLGDLFTPKSLARFDLLHSHVNPWFVQRCREAREEYGVAWVHTYHTLYFPEDWGGELKPWQKATNDCLRNVACKADVKICVSRWLQSHLRDQYGIETTYIPNGVDVSRCDAASATRFEKRFGMRDFALFIGTSASIKNPVAFIDLARRFPKRTFVMIGRRLSRELLETKYAIPLPRNLRVMGPMPHKDVLDAIAACRVFVTTSRSEGLPTVLMEAMALRTPVVGSDRFGVREVIGDPRHGFLHQFRNHDDLSNKFEAAWNDDGSTGRRARARVETEYDWTCVIRKLDGIYRRLLA